LTANQLVLSTQLFRSDPARLESTPWPQAIQRALVLLALPDVEMLMVVLDYLYTLTSISAIGLSICCLHPDILAIIKLLLVHVHHNCRLERLPAELLPIPEPKWYFQRPPIPEPIPEDVTLSVQESSRAKSPLVTGARTTPQTMTMSEVNQIVLPESQLKDLVNLTEPNRARQWMSRVFEPFPGGEVQQVTLWLAYKTQFENFQTPTHFGPGIQMIAPAEAIKLTSDVFPNALPSVTEHKSGEKKFVISGMRVRPKKCTSLYFCLFFHYMMDSSNSQLI
jgi:chromatin structure-remodeling complex subunit RSC9